MSAPWSSRISTTSAFPAVAARISGVKPGNRDRTDNHLWGVTWHDEVLCAMFKLLCQQNFMPELVETMTLELFYYW